ncbi:MAG TPA: 30S ribosomal protein S21 [Candidatus Coprosoma intestinipullorum]|uniref:Small ribosomal subunit protein bS21 n=1 Tax=Candidatus Coprosoma intestinipullorum TaxID=2840752 RepID=A0A9D0ZT63_9FIRM|nr:30S ribosomal protein S21 [Candidatus Coprosoma intestinipullorum]
MTKVMVHSGNVEGALRKLKVDKDGSRAKLKERTQGYLKPGVKRRNAKKEGIINTRRRNARENRYN